MSGKTTISDKGKNLSALALSLTLLLGVASCGDREVILQGERLDIRDSGTASDEETDTAVEDEPVVITKLALAAPVKNTEWTHRNGSAGHIIRHPALGRTITKVWSQNIGTGNSRKRGITSDPIIAGGRIFTMDAGAGLRAFTPSGSAIWSVDLTPPHEKASEATGGGLAYGSETLFATIGHGEVVALDPATGAIRWRHKMTGAVSAAPVVLGDTVVAVSRDNTALGLDTSNGRIRWRQQSSGGEAGVLGAGSPAASGGLVILPFASGEIVGAVNRNGLRAWSSVVSGGHLGIARNFVGDISGDPVVDGTTVYVANQSGRLAALDRRSGERNWSANDGSYSPVWPAGGAVFIISDEFAVKRLNASDGAEVWSSELPGYKAKRPKRSRDAYAYFGPTLAGGQIWVAGSDGLLRSYNPVSGDLTGTVQIPGGAASQPAVAGGRLYILSASGQLHAFQ
ncbi:MAG: PQQ-binding-like beta-propeller repeat protein [Rhodobacteraceae bacterium]|nr:PQQ-binding-like beta-propeller repeat protein [Paracoccaceae bacterium]